MHDLPHRGLTRCVRVEAFSPPSPCHLVTQGMLPTVWQCWDWFLILIARVFGIVGIFELIFDLRVHVARRRFTRGWPVNRPAAGVCNENSACLGNSRRSWRWRSVRLVEVEENNTCINRNRGCVVLSFTWGICREICLTHTGTGLRAKG